MDIIKKGVGEQLKKIRKINNLTQEALAEKIGINIRQLARIEAGKSFISSNTIFNICNALNISPKTLFDFKILETSIQSQNEETIALMEKLKNNIDKFANDKEKLEFLNIACQSLQNKNALNNLKMLIKGMELIKN